MEIYHVKRVINNILKELEEGKFTYKDNEKVEISEKNKKFILDFLKIARINVGEVQILKYLQSLKYFLKFCNKDFNLVEARDIYEFLNSMDGKAPKTKKIRYYCLKKFFEWMGMDIFKEMKIKFTNLKTKKLPNELIKPKEVDALILNCKNTLDKAIIGILYESGARISEFLNLKIKDVEIDRYGGILMLNGKTGQRRIRIVKYVNLLSLWLEEHPLKNKEAWLWVRELKNGRLKRVGYVYVRNLLRNLSFKINKRLHPHLFRHSRATELAKYLTESQLKQFFGWTQSSEMASIYVHLSGRDLDDKLLSIYGKKVEPEKRIMSNIYCLKCGFENLPNAIYCMKCGYPLHDKGERLMEFMVELMKIMVDEFPKAKKIIQKLASDKRFKDLFN